MENNEQIITSNKKSLIGLDGFLLLLGMKMSIFSPVGSLLFLFMSIINIYKFVDNTTNSQILLVFFVLNFLITNYFSIRAGLSLRLLKNEAINKTKEFLFVTSILVILQMYLENYLDLSEAIIVTLKFDTYYYSSIFSVIVTYLYLKLSKRVKANFPAENLKQ